eukprot:CAMPEP_0194484594 /NCGR_PEP_ID=MMETSP0253-20130528/5876_1 /TAXON_ID=2966 /ORGANISM="Noctiluca scintillans" /LENGTH=391 /DNA_ID=CAMNT_0039324427 /DNA_START=92 /DNA_END=1267 /DNA_ORIENTATION=+
MPNASEVIDSKIRGAVTSGGKVSDLHWAMSHNAYNNPEENPHIDMNQMFSVYSQLSFGVRVLEFDVHIEAFTNDVVFQHYHVSRDVDKGVNARQILDSVAQYLSNLSEPTVLIIKLENYIPQDRLFQLLQESSLADYWCRRATHSPNVCEVNLGDIGVKVNDKQTSKVLICHMPVDTAIHAIPSPKDPIGELDQDVFGWDDLNVSFACAGRQSGMVILDDPIIMPEPMPAVPFLDMNFVTEWDPRVAAVAGLSVTSGSQLKAGEVLFGSLRDPSGRFEFRVQQEDGNIVTYDGLRAINATGAKYEEKDGCATALVMTGDGYLEHHIFDRVIFHESHTIFKHGENRRVAGNVLFIQKHDGNAVVYPPGYNEENGLGHATWASQTSLDNIKKA